RAKPTAPSALPCGDPLAFEVLLDRQSFSPGEIDGKLGTNASHALAAFQAARGLNPTGEADCGTWLPLVAETSNETTVAYVIDRHRCEGAVHKGDSQGPRTSGIAAGARLSVAARAPR